MNQDTVWDDGVCLCNPLRTTLIKQGHFFHWKLTFPFLSAWTLIQIYNANYLGRSGWRTVTVYRPLGAWWWFSWSIKCLLMCTCRKRQSVTWDRLPIVTECRLYVPSRISTHRHVMLTVLQVQNVLMGVSESKSHFNYRLIWTPEREENILCDNKHDSISLYPRWCLCWKC